MSPLTLRRIAVVTIVAFPIGAWTLTASLMSGYPLSGWKVSTIVYFLRITPEYPLLYVAAAIGLVFALGLIILLSRISRRTEGFAGARYTRFVRGTETVTAKRLTAMCKEPNKVQVTVGGIPMPTEVENLHLMIGGATGAGKSVLLRELAASVHARGDRMIVIDPNGDLMSKFWKDGDVILNPYDSRTQGWSFFNEIRADYDYKRLAQSMVPISQDKNGETWNGYGRLLLRETAKKIHHMMGPRSSIYDLFRLCTIEPVDDIRNFLTGTLAESLFVGSSESSRALSSARFVLSDKLAEHTTMLQGRFSIRDWLADPKDSNLYINWREDMMESMKPLVSAWTDVFITSILSMPEDRNRRWWLFIDELASLDALPSLEAGLTKGRKNGLRIVAGLQSTSQLDHIYGQTKATTIRASFRNLVVMGGSKTDPKTARDMSDSLGEHEVEREEYSRSRSEDSRNRSDRPVRNTEKVVTPSEIQALPAMTGYVAFAGDRPIAKVSMRYTNYGMRVRPFEESKERMQGTSLPSTLSPELLEQQ